MTITREEIKSLKARLEAVGFTYVCATMAAAPHGGLLFSRASDGLKVRLNVATKKGVEALLINEEAAIAA